MTAYYLDRKLDTYHPEIVVVGCGGTGGFLADGLCRLMGGGDLKLVLIDHDRVEERNLARQNFERQDLGRFKAQALAERLARKYGRAVGYSLSPILPRKDYERGVLGRAGLVIGCVDNAMARQAIASRISADQWYLDAGNGENWGQLLIGNMQDREHLARSFHPEIELCTALPLPTVQQPELLAGRPVAPEPNCAEAVAAGDQGPVINQAMAALVLEVVRRLAAGTCTWMAVYLDLDNAMLRAVEATPEAVARVTGLRERTLICRRPHDTGQPGRAQRAA